MVEKIAEVALVTGAGRRIGRAIAEDLGAHGFAVAVHANASRDEAAAVAEAIRANGGAAAAFTADLSDSRTPAKLVDEIAETLGAPGLIVNSASLFEPDSAETFDPALFDAHMAVHVKAPVLLTAAMAKALPAGRDGLVVNMIDQRVWKLTPDFFSYTLSKAALWTATRTLAMAHAPRIRVNAIGPGPALASSRQQEADFRRQLEALPLKRGPAMDEFGATVRYLHATRSITGVMITLDGGQHLAWETPDVADMNE